ncbi:hypothetical protein OKA04_12350 [Luteolibacter flavescens]|uniref:Uncharacterized protein n=1 Tax=Luteolibacter flavescens TaxID=1859460 RepID=A0ABT3FPL6_9BACT|nr:hypothetical protein [Luteolibacter flavescens]MCW1885522.1 hypothetical protein [Luteolibacter flavescens]
MTLKLVTPGRAEIIEAAGITTTVLANHGIEVEAFDHKRNRIGRYIVKDQPPVPMELDCGGCFERAYLMEQGKTIEIIRQQTWEPLPPDEKSPNIQDWISFEDFVQLGITQGVTLHNGMPWSFDFHGHPVTHENDDLYLVAQADGAHEKFFRGQRIMIGPDGKVDTAPF